MTQLAGRIAAIQEAARHYPTYRPWHSDTIDLAAGDPSFPTPEPVGRAGIEAIEQNATKYTETRGTKALRAAVRDKFQHENGLTYGDDQVIVGVGSKQVLANALLATIEPGDEVILIAPHYGVFAQMIALVQGRRVTVRCIAQDGFRLDPRELRAALTDRTSWVILNNPVNPTGVVYTRSELEAIVGVVLEHPRAGVLSDEIYEHLTFGPERPVSPAALSPEAYDRTLTVSGVSKAYSMTGWRIGYGGGPADLVAAMARIQNTTTSSASSVSQAAAVAALCGPQGEVSVLRRRYAALAATAVEGMAAAPHLTPFTPEAGLYVLAECGGAIGLRAHGESPIVDDVALVEYIDRRAGVRTMPGTVFALPGWLRISFAVDEATLRNALARIGEALAELR